MNTNLIHKWLRDPKFTPDLEIVAEQVAETLCFPPVEIVERPGYDDTAPTPDLRPLQNVLEIDIVGGHRLRIIGGHDPEATRISPETDLAMKNAYRPGSM